MNANLSELSIEQLYAVLTGAMAQSDYVVMNTAFDTLVDKGVSPLAIVVRQNEWLASRRAARIAERLSLFGEPPQDAQNGGAAR